MFSTYHLSDALPEEKIITVIHRDIFIAIKRIVFFVLLLALPIVLIYMLRLLFPNLIEIAWAWPLLLILASSYLLFIWLLFFFSLLDYSLDVWIVTDIRIVDVRQDGLFSRSIAEVRLDKIQDISSQANGFFQTFLKYGNVIVQTASERNVLIFEEVDNPENIRDILVKLVDKEHVEHVTHNK